MTKNVEKIDKILYTNDEVKQMRRKIIISLFVITLFLLLGINKSSEAANISSNIDGINEGSYPGVKAQIKEIQRKYPNWKINVLYTGLNWQDAINGEYKGHGGSPSSLVPHTYNSGWICPICGDKPYDVSGDWRCASKEAIAYMMDPRNSLSVEYIFQFQDLSSSMGDRAAVKKMTQGTYLNQDSYIDAIMEAAKKHSVSPFHIVARLKQEQGANGTGIMNGYIYTIEEGDRKGEKVKVYNLFNIGVSGNGIEGILSGARKAYESGWFTPEASIKDGTKFIREKYIDVGQTTLYFQKFNVVDKSNLYGHQYMQNILAANNEGNSMYRAYNTNGILSSAFEFTIPLYENMPGQAAPRPTDQYRGSINTELIKIDTTQGSNGNTYLNGYLYIAEWVGGDCRTPRNLPELTLKSTDGKVSKKMYVAHQEGIRYYFDKVLVDVDLSKEYYIEAKLTSDKNIEDSSKKIQRVYLPDQTIKLNYQGKDIKVINNKIVFSQGAYQGDINTELEEIKLVKSTNGTTYIAGFVHIVEYINQSGNTPKSIPQVWLKSTDGEFATIMYVGYEGQCKYYFDKAIEDLDVAKTYYLEAKLTTEENTSQNQKQQIALPNKEVGTFGEITVVTKNNQIVLKYKGNINTELEQIKLIQNGEGKNYISGYIYIAEWIKGECRTPLGLPKLLLKATDGSYSSEMYVGYEDSIKYYFDKNIENLDTSKQYYIEAQLTSQNNIGNNKKQQVAIANRILENEQVKLEIKNNQIKMTDKTLYYGNINTEIYEMNVIQNGQGQNYISGHIYIAEWVEGECKTPSEIPQMTLKATDGSYSKEMYVGYEGGIEYYFDQNIEGILTDKTYYIEAKLTGKKNIASQNNKTQIANITPQGIVGIGTNGNKLKVEGNQIKVEDGTYYGNINTEMYQVNIIQNGQGQNYISGHIYIAEWVEGNCRTPSDIPQMTLKATDGSYSSPMYVGFEGGIEYYFDKNIEDLDINKQYYIEVQLTGKKNIASNKDKTQRANITKQGEVGITTNGNRVKIEGNKILLEKVTRENQLVGNPVIQMKQTLEEPEEIEQKTEEQEVLEDKPNTEIEEEEITENVEIEEETTKEDNQIQEVQNNQSESESEKEKN